MKLFFTIVSSQVFTILIVFLVYSSGNFSWDNSIKSYFVKNESLETIKKTAPNYIENSEIESVNWEEVDSEILTKIKDSKSVAEGYASRALESWKLEKIDLIDNEFLPWYFSYWNQQLLSFESAKNSLISWISSKGNNSSSANKLNEKLLSRVSSEFETRVFPIELTRLRMEFIVEETVRSFLEHLSLSLTSIQRKYQINHTDWRSHIVKLSAMSAKVEGNREHPILFKTLAGTTMVGSAGMALGASKAILRSISAKVLNKSSKILVNKAITNKLANRAGAKLLMKAGKRRGLAIFSGPFALASLGLISAWEVWDHNNTVAKNKPLLRRSLLEYLDIVVSELKGKRGMASSALTEISNNLSFG